MEGAAEGRGPAASHCQPFSAASSQAAALSAQWNQEGRRRGQHCWIRHPPGRPHCNTQRWSRLSAHYFHSCMEAGAGAAACCEDEWGVAAWDTLSNRQEMCFGFFVFCFFPCLFLLRRPMTLLRPEISVLFLSACVKVAKVNATSLGSLLHYHRMGVNGLLCRLNIPSIPIHDCERAVTSLVT